MFFKKMFEAIDIAAMLFKSIDEEKEFIKKAWNNYGDDIAEHIYGAIGDSADYDTLPKEERNRLMENAIADNSEPIFGFDIFG